MPRLMAVLALGALAGGCATSYRRPVLGMTGGYSDRQVGGGRWEVTFAGNDFTSPAFVLNGALYRAAELARQNGHPYFQLIQSSVVIGEFSERGGYGQASGHPLPSGAVYLTIQGANSSAAPTTCLNNYRRGCRTFATDEVIRQLAPIVH